MTTPSLALWWLPAGERPRPAEAMARLAFLGKHGPTEAAFNFRGTFGPPEAPASDGVVGSICYGKRRFAAVSNGTNGDRDTETVFEYRQSGGRVRARYSGPGIVFGSLVAASDASGSLDMHYRRFTPEGALRAGQCRTTPEVLANGKLRLHEQWQWTTGDRSSGRSILKDLRQ